MNGEALTYLAEKMGESIPLVLRLARDFRDRRATRALLAEGEGRVLRVLCELEIWIARVRQGESEGSLVAARRDVGLGGYGYGSFSPCLNCQDSGVVSGHDDEQVSHCPYCEAGRSAHLRAQQHDPVDHERLASELAAARAELEALRASCADQHAMFLRGMQLVDDSQVEVCEDLRADLARARDALKIAHERLRAFADLGVVGAQECIDALVAALVAERGGAADREVDVARELAVLELAATREALAAQQTRTQYFLDAARASSGEAADARREIAKEREARRISEEALRAEIARLGALACDAKWSLVP